MTQFLLTIEFFRNLLRIPFVRYLVIGVGFYLLIGYRFCDRNTEPRSAESRYTESSYTPKYGQLSKDCLKVVLSNTLRENPDMTAEMLAEMVNDTVLMRIDERIEKSKEFIVNFKIKSGQIVPIEQ